MVSGLTVDLYELTMAASYLRRGMQGDAVFSLFVRDLPPDRGFLVAAGVEDCLDSLEGYGFNDDDVEYLAALGLTAADIEALRTLHFTGDVWAVPEGRIVFANEPILEVTAPIAEAQLVETLLLNHVTHQTALATAAARCRIASRDRLSLVDFAFRRTHGIDAAMAVARVTAMVGFTATSNVLAARRFGLRATGTMAHSYVQAFGTERDAFVAYAEDFPDRCTFLVDTYDTESGVRNAIDVIRSMNLTENVAVRLDSGDLAALASRARQLLDDAGLDHVRIVVSGGLDEYGIEALVQADGPIDGVGVGTRMGVAAEAPYLDSVYKLVAFDGRPVRKLSPGKQTLPGAKQVYRRPDGDLLALRDERPPADGEPLLELAMRNGERVRPAADIASARQRFETDLAALPEAARRLRDAVAPDASLSPALTQLAERTPTS